MKEMRKRERFVAVYSLEEFSQKKEKDQLKKEEEDGQSVQTFTTALSSINMSLYQPDDSEDDDEEENELRQHDELAQLNKIYNSDHTLMEQDLPSLERKLICKCLKGAISSGLSLFTPRGKQKRFQTLNSLEDIELKHFIQTVGKAKGENEDNKYSIQNYVMQNLEGEGEMKLMISSNSIEDKNKIMSYLFANKQNNKKEGNSKGNGDDSNSEDEYGLGSLKTNPLTIIKKKFIHQSKAIDMEIFDTLMDFHKQKTSTIYYKIANVFLVIINSENCNTAPLSFAKIIHKEYENHAFREQKKMIIVDINSDSTQKTIELYCERQGITYIRLDKDYTSLPETLINYLFLFTTSKPPKKQLDNLSLTDSLGSGIEYDITEAFDEAAPIRALKRALSTTLTK